MTRAPGLLALGVLLCLLGQAFATPALLVPGLGLALLSSLALIWVGLAARRCRVQRTVSRTLVQEGEAFTVIVTLAHGRVRPPGGVLVPWPDSPVLHLGRGLAESVSVRSSFARRGRHLVAPARVRIVDPLGLCARETHSAAQEVLVLPRISAISGAGGKGIGVAGRTLSISQQVAALEVDSLRPYRPGSAASRIHWPTVARTGSLMEHRLVSDTDRRPLIVLDTREPDSVAALDQAVRAVASLAHHLARHGGCGVLLPGDRRPTALDSDLRAWPTLHARLALVSAGGTVSAPARLARSGMLMWVVARPLSARAALTRLGLQQGFLVSPFPISGRAIAFTAAGCSGQAIGTSARARVA